MTAGPPAKIDKCKTYTTVDVIRNEQNQCTFLEKVEFANNFRDEDWEEFTDRYSATAAENVDIVQRKLQTAKAPSRPNSNVMKST